LRRLFFLSFFLFDRVVIICGISSSSSTDLFFCSCFKFLFST